MPKTASRTPKKFRVESHSPHREYDFTFYDRDGNYPKMPARELQAFIVRAINSHDELVGALKRAFNLIKESGFTSGLAEEEFDATLEQAGEALAKAEASDA